MQEKTAYRIVSSGSGCYSGFKALLLWRSVASIVGGGGGGVGGVGRLEALALQLVLQGGNVQCAHVDDQRRNRMSNNQTLAILTIK